MEKYYLLTQRKAENGTSGEDHNTEYDFSKSCSLCGTGSTVKSNLIVVLKRRSDLIQTLTGDYLISEVIHRVMAEYQIRGVKDIKYVVNTKKEKLQWYHLTSNSVMPPMVRESQGIVTEGQCPQCKRDGHFSEAIIGNPLKGIPTKIIPPLYTYLIADNSIFKKSEILITWECFGVSNLKAHGKYVVHYARPKPIVSERVRNIFEKLQVKNAVFHEIKIALTQGER